MPQPADQGRSYDSPATSRRQAEESPRRPYWSRQLHRPLTQEERSDAPPRILNPTSRIRVRRGLNEPGPSRHEQVGQRGENEDYSPPRGVARPRRPSTPQSRARLQRVLGSIRETDSAFQAADPYVPDGGHLRASPGPRWRARRYHARSRSQAMSDRALVQLQEASDRLAQTNEDINASFAAMRAIDYEPRGLRRPREDTSHSTDNNARRKRRRTGDKQMEHYPKIEYGYHGQIVAGKLDMEIDYADGGLRELAFPGFQDNVAAQRILQDDAVIYRSKGTPCNIVLRHRGETTFTLERLVIKMPPPSYSNSASAGLVFVSMDQNDTFVRTLKYRVLHFPSCYFSAFPTSASRHRKRAKSNNTSHSHLSINASLRRSRSNMQETIADLENICDTPSESELESFSGSSADSDSTDTSDIGDDDDNDDDNENNDGRSGSDSEATSSISSRLPAVTHPRLLPPSPRTEDRFRQEENFVRELERRHLGISQPRISTPPPAYRTWATSQLDNAIASEMTTVESSESGTPERAQQSANNAMLSELLARGTGVQVDRAQRRQAREDLAAAQDHETATRNTEASNITTTLGFDRSAATNTAQNNNHPLPPVSSLHLHLLTPRAYFTMRQEPKKGSRSRARRHQPNPPPLASVQLPPQRGVHPSRTVWADQFPSENNTSLFDNSDSNFPRPRTGDETITRVIEFDPPISGRYMLLKMWNPRKEGVVEINSVEARGWAGLRWFPAFEGR